MANQRFTRTPKGKKTYATELSSGQLIVAICIALIVALACFLMGVIVGRFEEPKKGTQVANGTAPATSPGPRTPVASRPSREPSKSQSEGQGEQVSPVKYEQVSPAAAARIDYSKPAFPETIPPAPAARSSRAPTSAAKSEEKDEAPKKPAEAADIEGSTPPPAPAKESEPDTKKDKPAATPPSAPAKVEKPAEPSQPPSAARQAESKPATTTPARDTSGGEASKKGRYGVQVVAFSSGERKAAEQYKARLEANTELRADLVASKDGKYIRVLIGDYAEKGAAAKARDELRKRKGFADCFVQSR